MRIIDRCKHIFKLSQGKYIAPERLEEIYLRSHWVSQIFIDGRSTQATVVAIVVPDEEYIQRNFNFGKAKNFQELCLVDELKQLIMIDLHRLAKENKLKYYEMLSNIYIHHEPFSQQNGLITSTLKTRRLVAGQRFKTIIDSLYNVDKAKQSNVL